MNLTAAALFLVLLTAPFQWVVFFQIDALSLKPIHLASVAGAVAFVVNWRSTVRLLFANRAFVVFSVLYTLYLSWLWVAVTWSDDAAAGVVSQIKDTGDFFLFMIISGLAAKLAERGNLQSFAGITSIVALMAFAGYMTLKFFALGYNVFVEYATAIARADVLKLHHWFYPRLFNCTFDGVCVSTDEGKKTSLRNMLLGALCIYFVLMAWWRERLRGWQRVCASAGIIAAAFFIVVSVSRSMILVLLLTIVGTTIIRGLQRRSLSARHVMVWASLLVVGATAVFSGQFGGAASILEERFAAIGRDVRIGQYNNAMTKINEDVFFGNGIGTGIISGSEEMKVHNVLLASWLEAGIMGLVLSFLWYGAIVWGVTRLAQTAHSGTRPDISPWIIALPVLPLLRVLVEGGGRISLVELIALALFFGATCRAAVMSPSASMTNRAIC